MTRHIEITRKEDCCGCGACEASCPVDCITMEFDTEGFKYPVINADRCIDCGRCTKACPIIGDNANLGALPVAKALTAANRDEAVRAASTSGGVFFALATAIISDGGIVAGARYENDLSVVHDIASTVEEASAFRGSKYVQSDLTKHDVYRRVKESLNSGAPVLFSGTPCQVQGLRTYLGKDYPSLVTCDFVCRAVPSPCEWRSYLRDMEVKFNSKPVVAVFRNKTYGYHSGSMKVEFENGTVYYGSGRVDPMHKAFFADLISRPSCYECRFRRSERSSDFTIFDCWSYSKLTGCEDDDLGHTHVWVRTEKAAELLSKVGGQLEMRDVDISQVLASDGIMAVRNISCNPNREAFLAYSSEAGITAAVQKFIPITPKDLLVERSKGLLHRLGLLEAMAKAKRSRKMDKIQLGERDD